MNIFSSPARVNGITIICMNMSGDLVSAADLSVVNQECIFVEDHGE